jgi:hypothetical protein
VAAYVSRGVKHTKGWMGSENGSAFLPTTDRFLVRNPFFYLFIDVSTTAVLFRGMKRNVDWKLSVASIS